MTEKYPKCTRRDLLAGMALALVACGLPEGTEHVVYPLSASSNLPQTLESKFRPPVCSNGPGAKPEVFNTVMRPSRLSRRQITKVEDLQALPDISLNPKLGTRLDLAEFVGATKKLGMGWISIYAGHGNFENQPGLMSTYQAAARLGIQTLWILNPQHLISDAQIEKMITPILQVQRDYPVKGWKNARILIEPDNEPDLNPPNNSCQNPQSKLDPSASFWLRQNLRDCARYNRRFQDVADRIGDGKIQYVTPSLHNIFKLPTWLNYLASEGVDLNQAIYSAHTYGTSLNTWITGMVMRWVIGKRPFIFAEIGSQSADPNRLPKMFKMAQRFNPLFSIYHELLNIPNPDPGQFGWGAINSKTGAINERFFSIRNYNQQMAVNFR